jgi:hypothetical protein
MNKEKVLKLVREYMIEREEVGYNNKCKELFKLIKSEIDVNNKDECCIVIKMFYSFFEVDDFNNDFDYKVNSYNDLLEELMEVCEYSEEDSRELIKDDIKQIRESDLFGFDING